MIDKMQPKECKCGSGEEPWPMYDARGIFVAYACEACEDDIYDKYRKDIFTDPNYWHDEPIDED